VSQALRILLTGGGTGGHVYPALAVAANAHQDEEFDAEFQYVGSSGGLERGIVAKAGIPFVSVDAGAVRGRSPIAGVLGLGHNARGVFQAQRVIREFRPDVVLATGGFVCVPVVLAAKLTGVPSVVYLPDLRPGWAVRFLSRIATAIAVSFEEVRPYVPSRRVYVTGYPVRPELLTWTRQEARQELGLPQDGHVVLVMGGSQGARTINDAIGRDLEPLLERAWLIHATGSQNYRAAESRRSALPDHLRERYRLYPYLDGELAPAMAAASLVISRAGASPLGELPAVGVPGILVPYPFAGAHQYLNAEFLAERGVVEIVDDAVAQNGGLATAALVLLANTAKLDDMANAARRLARLDAAAQLFRLVAQVASSRLGISVGRLA
jgi:UDP-N-acetylglucosamine--N-acetylmuramyl-(pentapeptide) pyrophosphoryl-undecaprenol N-acetylglucosamine transferase